MLRDLLHRRVKDGGIGRLIGKWLNAGVLEAGELLHPPGNAARRRAVTAFDQRLPAHVLDEWFERDVRPRLNGRALLIRYADDFIIGCELEGDVRRLMEVLPKRLGKYGLSLHSGKSRLVRFPPEVQGRPGGSGMGYSIFWASPTIGGRVIEATGSSSGAPLSKRQRA